MARTLFETLKSQLQTPAAGQPAPVVGETERAQKLLQAKLGKAVEPGVTPRISAEQERLAASQAQAGLGRLAAEGQLAGEEIAQQAEAQRVQEREQALGLEQRQKDLTSQFERQSEQLLGEFERGQKRLESDRDAAAAEQLGFMIRFNNKDYVNNLQQVGQRNRLDNMINFKEQLAQDIFAEQRDIFKDNLAYQKIAAADERDFIKMLSQMDLNFAMDIARTEAKQAAAQQIATGVGSLVQAGSSAYDKGLFTTKEKPPVNTPGDASVSGGLPSNREALT